MQRALTFVSGAGFGGENRRRPLDRPAWVARIGKELNHRAGTLPAAHDQVVLVGIALWIDAAVFVVRLFGVADQQDRGCGHDVVRSDRGAAIRRKLQYNIIRPSRVRQRSGRARYSVTPCAASRFANASLPKNAYSCSRTSVTWSSRFSSASTIPGWHMMTPPSGRRSRNVAKGRA